MPRKEHSVMDGRRRFAARLADGEAMTEVCHALGIYAKPTTKSSTAASMPLALLPPRHPEHSPPRLSLKAAFSSSAGVRLLLCRLP